MHREREIRSSYVGFQFFRDAIIAEHNHHEETVEAVSLRKTSKGQVNGMLDEGPVRA